MSTGSVACRVGQAGRELTLLEKLNGPWHKYALWTYTMIVLAHWAEHLAQTTQIYVLGWSLPESRGVVGLWFPWVIKSEALHYMYAIVMLIAFWILRTGFVGRSYKWWMVAFWIQFWHHIEHAILQGQVIFQTNLFGKPAPWSIAQLFIPRVELHLFYNTIVFVPMVIAMFYHMFPSPGEEAHMGCSCSWNPKPAKAATQTA
jgi:hypothetical protein